MAHEMNRMAFALRGNGINVRYTEHTLFIGEEEDKISVLYKGDGYWFFQPYNTWCCETHYQGALLLSRIKELH